MGTVLPSGSASAQVNPDVVDLGPVFCDPLSTAVPSDVLPVEGVLPPCASGAAPTTVMPTTPGPSRSFLYSLVLPGAGQWALGQRRWALYSLVELFAWVRLLERRDTGFHLRDDYRDLAWDAARARFGGQRVDGDFEYYEKLSNFTASGAFDADPSRSGIQPESDPRTFNGQIWQLATGIFFPSGTVPAEGSALYQQALEYYVERGYGESFLWDWTDRAAERTTFRDLIRRSDDALRSSTTMIGVVIANHLASAIDGYLSARLAAASDATLRIRVYPVRSVSEAPLGAAFNVSLLH